jgi:FkbM family methyltransferase
MPAAAAAKQIAQALRLKVDSPRDACTNALSMLVESQSMAIGRIAHLVGEKSFRLGINITLRIMRSMMRMKGVKGYLSVGAEGAFFEYDRMRFMYHFARFGVAGNIDSGGGTEPLTRAKLLSLLAPGLVFYDVGAHEGLFTLDVRTRFPAVVIHAFEPLVESLVENLALNDIDDVHVHAVAVGNRLGEISITAALRSSNYISENSKAGNEKAVPMITLDTAVPEGAEPPDIVKLDIEGFELHALWGFEAGLKNHQPLVITEVNHCLLRYHKDLVPFTEYMTRLGYVLHRLEGDRLISLADGPAPMRVEELPASDESNYWWIPDRWLTKTLL